MCNHQLYDIISYYLPNVGGFADDTQIYYSFQADSDTSREEAICELECCIAAVRESMLSLNLKLNDSKTELLVIGSRQQLTKIDLGNFRFKIGSTYISSVPSARNLGVIFDSNMTFARHINDLSRKSFLHITRIKQIKNYLNPKIVESLIHALIFSKIDYCNSLLYGLPNIQLSKLQRIQNASARLLTNTPKYAHITPVLKELHWLPVKSRIIFKIALLTFKSLHDLGPTSLKDMLEIYDPPRALRSCSKNLLAIPRFCNTFGKRSFAHCAPTIWKTLPEYVKNHDSVNSFKKALKTYLFNKHFN